MEQSNRAAIAQSPTCVSELMHTHGLWSFCLFCTRYHSINRNKLGETNAGETERKNRWCIMKEQLGAAAEEQHDNSEEGLGKMTHAA